MRSTKGSNRSYKKHKAPNKEQVRKRGLPPLFPNRGGKPLFLTC